MDKIQGLLTKESHFDSQEFKCILDLYLKESKRYHRKQWELVYILQMLNLKGLLHNTKGLSFASGEENLVPILANNGVNITASDLELEEAREKGWATNDTNNQHSTGISQFMKHVPRLCDYNKLKSNMQFMTIDMNNIPDNVKLGKYDFAYSCCAFEHLGSISAGLNFVIESIKCVKINGIVVHTTEFNIDSLNSDYDGATLQEKNCVIFRKSDIEKLKVHVENLGHKMYEIDYDTGNGYYDTIIDVPPYSDNTHLKLKIGTFKSTCIGIIIERLV